MHFPDINGALFRRITGGAMGLIFLLMIALTYVLITISTGCGSLGPSGGGLSGSAFLPGGSRPADCADSVIWDLTGNPTLVGVPLVIAVYEVAKHKPQYRAALIETVGYVESLMARNPLTYADFALAVVERIEWLNRYMGVELLMVTDLVAGLDQPVPISECDRRLICQHLAKQRRYLSTLK